MEREYTSKQQIERQEYVSDFTKFLFRKRAYRLNGRQGNVRKLLGDSALQAVGSSVAIRKEIKGVGVPQLHRRVKGLGNDTSKTNLLRAIIC